MRRVLRATPRELRELMAFLVTYTDEAAECR
jgi:hypothetical protein